VDELEIDILTFNEHKIIFQHKDNRRTGLGKLFHGGETMTRSVGGNIKHPFAKQFGHRMEGGTGIVSCGELESFVRADLSGMDTRGLARWSYMTFSDQDGHLTTVIVGYNPCRTTASHTSSSYQLHKAYFTMAEKDMTCPCRRFEADLIAILRLWCSEGRRIIVGLDMNDHVYHSCLGRALVESDDLNLQETILTQTGQGLMATNFC